MRSEIHPLVFVSGIEVCGTRQIPVVPDEGVQANFDLSQVENTIEEVVVTVKKDEEPVENQTVTVTAEWEPGSGGHDHGGSDDLLVPPQDDMGWIVNLEEADSAEGELQTFTNADGQIKLRYRAPEFGGNVVLKAAVVPPNADTLFARDTLSVHVADLVLLPAFDFHEKIGGTPSHHGPRLDSLHLSSRTPDNNHWVNEVVGALLVSLAVIYSEQFPSSPTIRYNDISLPNGGLFDINGRWVTDHQLHRIGQNVDVRTSPPQDDGIPLVLVRRMEEILIDLDPNSTIQIDGSRRVENGRIRDSRHFHVDFEIF